MRDSARILLLLLLLLVQSLSIVHRGVVGWRKGGGVCWGLLESRPGHLMLHSQHLRAAITGRIVVGGPGHQRRS